ncbi:GNAT family N-acetyltransferase [Daejeonella oryzae]|uniref:GNAT family N-acetyltransferase n=1 Tax=Daejeonella oryzae TaxID=1122943 RepID=UPI0004107489|nr:GNAT family N-acetyltransferase [Daejeonella oryzae]
MRVNYKVVTIDQKTDWDSYVNRSNIYDFYHTWYYHQLENEGEPFLFVYEYDEYFIALPLLKRRINESEYFDCTSVYGYAGPITNIPAEILDESVVLKFKETLLTYFESVNIISVFSRLHPIINEDTVWDNLGSIFKHGRTVTIDLRNELEEQRKLYQRTIRSKVKQLNTKGFTVREANMEEDLDQFIQIYTDNMVKVKASSYYFFDKKYFRSMLDSSDFESKLIVSFHEGKMTSGAIITFSNEIMQFHLAATHNEFLKEGPMKLLIDEVTKIGRYHGMKYMHMGGGVGGNEDNLFNFKAGFSDFFLDFKTWRLIVNEEKYFSLIKDQKIASTNSNYFPLYRYVN